MAHDDFLEDDKLFKALAHRTRLRIVLLLRAHGGEMNSGGIAEQLACRWPTTIGHLAALQRAKLITVGRHGRDGRERVYRLNGILLRQSFAQWLKFLEANGRLGRE